MIVDTIDTIHLYAARHPALAAAETFLMQPATRMLADGRYAIDGDRIFALVTSGCGRGLAAARLEAHRCYIDVQWCVTGSDCIGIAPVAVCSRVDVPYDPQRDIIFFNDSPVEWITITGLQCALFFPSDAHAPLAGTDPFKKIVVKIAVV